MSILSLRRRGLSFGGVDHIRTGAQGRPEDARDVSSACRRPTPAEGRGPVVARALVVWILLALLETLHGNVRVRVLNRLVGDRRARQIGVFTGSAIVFAIAWALVPWIGAVGRAQLLGVGALWLALMLGFDVAFGRWVFKASWQRIGAEFDIRRGGLLGLGMLFVVFAPLLAAALRGRP